MRRIINNLMMYSSNIPNLGLYHGKTGIVIFLEHYAKNTFQK